MTTNAFSKIYVFDGGGKGQCAGVCYIPGLLEEGIDSPGMLQVIVSCLVGAVNQIQSL